MKGRKNSCDCCLKVTIPETFLKVQHKFPLKAGPQGERGIKTGMCLHRAVNIVSHLKRVNLLKS